MFSKDKEKIQQMFDKMNHVRLIEEDISYEDLAVIENFSDDEITFELKR